MRRLAPILILALLLAGAMNGGVQTCDPGGYLTDLNGGLDYVAVVTADNSTTLVLNEGDHYLVVEESNELRAWSLFNGTGKSVEWKTCWRGGENNGTQEISGPVVFMDYLLPVLNGSPLYERKVTCGSPIEVTLVRKPGVPPYENVTVNDTEYGPQTLRIPINDWIRANLTVSDGRLKEVVMVARYPNYFNLTAGIVRVDIKIVYRGEKDYKKLKARVLKRYTELLMACSGKPSAK